MPALVCLQSCTGDQTRWHVLVNEPSRGELRVEAVAENFSETSLVMIKALLRLIVYATNINDDVAGIQDSRVSGAFQVLQNAYCQNSAGLG